MKSRADNFEDSARVALNVDSALCQAGIPRTNNGRGYFSHKTECSSEAVPMEIENIQTQSTRSNVQMREQRKSDMEKGACFTCHTEGCRPWKHKKANLNHIQADENGSNIDLDIKQGETVENSSGSENE